MFMFFGWGPLCSIGFRKEKEMSYAPFIVLAREKVYQKVEH